MPIINLAQQGQPVANFSANGPKITINDLVVDCEQMQSDTTEIVEIRQGSTGPEIGGDGSYLAVIKIPAKQYTEELVEDEDGNQVSSYQAEPLDPNAIAVQLWPIA